jgi:hypothetical protein
MPFFTAWLNYLLSVTVGDANVFLLQFLPKLLRRSGHITRGIHSNDTRQGWRSSSKMDFTRYAPNKLAVVRIQESKLRAERIVFT